MWMYFDIVGGKVLLSLCYLKEEIEDDKFFMEVFGCFWVCGVDFDWF